MPAESPPAEAAFKHWFSPERYRRIADTLGGLSRGFDRRRFLDLTLAGLDDRSLMERLRQSAIGYEAALPGSYREKLEVLRAFAPTIDHSFVAISLGDFVAREGLQDPERSLEALRFFTRFGSSEFAVRPFLQSDLSGTLATMERWALDPDEHVRRLASEGSRPRLPWGLRLKELVRDPRPTGPILEMLRDDPALYVRKSVANHLNDIAKDHPDAVIDRVSGWDRSRPGTAWIVRHAVRTLVKKGDVRALGLMGATARTSVDVTRFSVSPKRLKLGEKLEIEAELTSTSRREQTLVVDYVVHYVKASGGTSAKVFKWATVTLAAGKSASLVKRQQVRDFTTRRHFEGKHRVDLQINGQRPASAHFMLHIKYI